MKIPIGEFQVRSFEIADVCSIARYADNPRIASQLRDRFPSPYSEDRAREWIEFVLQQPEPSNFAIASEQEAIGGIGLDRQADVNRRSAELGYWLAEPFWGRGIMTRAVRALTRYAFEQTDLLRVFAMPFATNPASSRVLERAGYQLEGRLRQAVVKNDVVCDQLVYACLREEYGS